MEHQTSLFAMLATDVVTFLLWRDGYDLNVAGAHDKSMRRSNGLDEDDSDDTTQPDAAREPVQKVVPAKKAPAEEAKELTPVELLSNSTRERSKNHVEEPSSRGRVDMPPHPHERARIANPQRSLSRPQGASSSTPTTANVAHPTSTTATSTRQREQPNKRTRPTLPKEGPSNVMPGLTSAYLQPAEPPHRLTYVQTLQTELHRIYTDREKIRDKMMRARSAVGDLQSQLVQLGKERNALLRENDALWRENEELKRNRPLDPDSTHNC